MAQGSYTVLDLMESLQMPHLTDCRGVNTPACELVVRQCCPVPIVCVESGDYVLEQILLKDVTLDWVGFAHWTGVVRERIVRWIVSVQRMCDVIV